MVRALRAELEEESEGVDRMGRYYEAMQEKQELESRLAEVRVSIEDFKDSEYISPRPPKLSHLSHEARLHLRAEEEHKRSLSSNFTNRLIASQKQRMQRQKSEFNAFQLKIEAEKAEKQQKLIEKEAILRVEKEKWLETIKNKAEKRKIDLETLRKRTEERVFPKKHREITSEPASTSSPVFTKREPKLRHKQNTAISPQKYTPSPIRYFKSPVLEKVLKSDQELKSVHFNAVSDRKKRVEKGRHYADIVKAMFFPAIDSVKQKELELAKHKLANPGVKIRHGEEAISKSMDVGGRKSAQKRTISVKKRPKLTEFLPEAGKSQGKVVDYLAKMQVQREKEAVKAAKEGFEEMGRRGNSVSFEWIRSSTDAQGEVRRIERLAAKHIQFLRHLDPSSPSSIQLEASVNELIVSSVKAKLALLDRLT